MAGNEGSVELTSAGAAAQKSGKKEALPAPFIAVPQDSALQEFLKHLDKSVVYITHLDTHPWQFKRKIYLAPVVLNLAISAGLLWRIYKMFPFYMDLLLLILGQDSPAKVDRSTKTNKQMLWIISRRGLNMFLDFLLFRFLAMWPLTFFLQAPSSPVSWRWNVGFNDSEIIVRESTGWGKKDLFDGLAQGSNSPFFKTRILPALDKELLKKSGYLLIRPDWGLCFYGMIEATKLVKDGSLSFDDFKKTVYVHHDVHGWVYWVVHELDKDSEEEARKKIVLFKERLTALGKESLFFRWVELIQFESTQPGGFTRERQEAAVQKVKTLFEREGVDFEEFVKSIGGVDSLPGMVEVKTD